jgi:GMP synthase (glutamine-hydrolysing)
VNSTGRTAGAIPQIVVLDAGGQYCHLITRKVRELSVYAEIRASETPAAELAGAKGIIISGGPASVYAEGSPTVDPAIFGSGAAVLGICYGQQLMAYLMGGGVRKGVKGEYGLAFVDLDNSVPLFRGTDTRQQVWMSHRDQVDTVPPGFRVLGGTDTCRIGAMGDTARGLYGVQFHPEVVHTKQGAEILSNFLFTVCACQKDWDPKHQVPALEQHVRDVVGDRNVFFFVSGGVDSTVAYTLCLRALGDARVRGAYVDTGLMREGETDFVRGVFESVGTHGLAVESARKKFLGALAGVRDPEKKRNIIGEKFVEVQEQILQSGHFLDGNWILGQGTIYPDTIESGGTSKADVIKTHHNRVAGIQRLLAENRIIEPLSLLYKDEVRDVGRDLGLPEELLQRHPFPGPGLAIRCLCAEIDEPLTQLPEGWLVPVRSVGVQGDERSYRSVLALEAFPSPQADLQARGTDLINSIGGINRVIALVETKVPLGEIEVRQSELHAVRLDRLRRADAIVRRLVRESGFEREVWQFPVILVPAGTPDLPDSVVLRPIHSVDGMTAQSVSMPEPLLRRMAGEILEVEGVCAVFYDLTHKPPGTIEWE